MLELIKITNLNYINIFKNFSISFPKQKIIFLTGPNNCGKTTLIRILAGEIYLNKCLEFNNQLVEENTLDNYLKNVKSIIPTEIAFTYNSLEEEILSYLNKTNIEEYNYLLRNLSLTKLKKNAFSTLSIKELIKIKLLLILLNCPKLLLLDDIGLYFTKEESAKIINLLKQYQKQKKLTVIMTTSNLEETLLADYLYVLNQSTIFLEGTPLEVLSKDNLLNKIGLQLPFMVDLSVKLKDYDLIKTIELDMKRMVDKLWK